MVYVYGKERREKERERERVRADVRVRVRVPGEMRKRFNTYFLWLKCFWGEIASF